MSLTGRSIINHRCCVLAVVIVVASSTVTSAIGSPLGSRRSPSRYPTTYEQFIRLLTDKELEALRILETEKTLQEKIGYKEWITERLLEGLEHYSTSERRETYRKWLANNILKENEARQRRIRLETQRRVEQELTEKNALADKKRTLENLESIADVAREKYAVASEYFFNPYRSYEWLLERYENIVETGHLSPRIITEHDILKRRMEEISGALTDGGGYEKAYRDVRDAFSDWRECRDALDEFKRTRLDIGAKGKTHTRPKKQVLNGTYQDAVLKWPHMLQRKKELDAQWSAQWNSIAVETAV